MNSSEKIVITNIKHASKGRSFIYADGEYLLSMPTELVVKSRIRKGLEISQEHLSELLFKTEFYRVKEKALNILSYRAHSRGELEFKIKDGFSEEVVCAVLDNLEESSLLNDENFAKDYACYLYRSKGYAVKRIKLELKNKKIDSETIAKIIDDLELDEISNLERIIEKKRFKNLEDKKLKQRALSYLMRLGYSWDQINSCL